MSQSGPFVAPQPFQYHYQFEHPAGSVSGDHHVSAIGRCRDNPLDKLFISFRPAILRVGHVQSIRN